MAARKTPIRLTEEQKSTIQKLKAQGMLVGDVAREMGLKSNVVYYHYMGDVEHKKAHKTGETINRLTDEDKLLIRKYRNEDLTIAIISKLLNKPISTISSYVNREKLNSPCKKIDEDTKQLISRYKNEGKSISEIAALTGIHRSSVTYWYYGGNRTKTAATETGDNGHKPEPISTEFIGQVNNTPKQENISLPIYLPYNMPTLDQVINVMNAMVSDYTNMKRKLREYDEALKALHTREFWQVHEDLKLRGITR